MPTLLSRCTVLLSALVPLTAGCAMSAGADGGTPSTTGTGSIEAENAVVSPQRAQLGNLTTLLGGTAPRAEIFAENESCNPSSSVAPGDGGWRAMDFTGQEWAFGARYQHTAIWDGREMIVFGGAVGDAPEAAAYEPSRDEWSRVPASPLRARVRHHAVWTGHSMIVWGGAINSEDGESTTYFDDGALYDPCAKTWRFVATAPGAFHEGSTAVWATTTRELVVLGGEGSTNGWAYRPATDTWRTIAVAPITTSGSRGPLHAVWTGTELVAYDGA
ncbi:MAG: hypothetical protein ABI175_13735, partial [Polyangiales bacterium]